MIRVKVKNICIYLATILITLRLNLLLTQRSIDEGFSNFLFISACLLILIQIFTSKYTVMQLFMLVVLTLVIVKITLVTGSNILLFMLFFVYAIQDIDLVKIIYIYTFITTSLFIYTVMNSLFTGTNISLYGGWRENVGLEERYIFGFVHPNTLQGTYFRVVVGLIFCCKNKKWINKLIICCVLGGFLLFTFSKSRAGFLVLLIYLVTFLMTKGLQKIIELKKLAFIYEIIYIFIVFFTLYSCYTYGKNKIIVLIDSVLTGRFMLASRIINKVSLSIWGNYLPRDYVIDCGITATLVIYGILFFIIVLFIYLIGIKKAVNDGDAFIVATIVSFIFYSMIEDVYANIFLNLGFLFCMNYTVLTKKSKYNVTLKGK